MLRISGLQLPLDCKEGDLRRQTACLLQVDPEEIRSLSVVRRAVDARRGQVRWCCTVEAELRSGEEAAVRRCGTRVRLAETPPAHVIAPQGPPLAHRPVVVGAGPAGIMGALTLAEYGYRPLVIERGPDVDTRALAIGDLFERGLLHPDANIQFGEGGAGAWSDGKLATRIRDPRCRQALDRLVGAGAPESILTDAQPHIGTDGLRGIVKNLRERVEKLGGSYRFSTAMEGVLIREGRVEGVRLRDGGLLPADAVILAIGHSARDTVETLLGEGVAMQAKGFAAGVRIEHPQSLIDRARYGKHAGHPVLGPADYSLKTVVRGVAVYSFCMCPGGFVINASSEEAGLCVNGMSNQARDGVNANAAIVCSIGPGAGGPLSGIAFQRGIERAAYGWAGGYRAPAQRLDDFLSERESRDFGGVNPTVRPPAAPSDLGRILPGFIAGALREAMRDFNRMLPGFLLPDAVLTAAETRTSSPVRMLRGESGESVSAAGLYPAGEGAGYAGGILSAAADGIRAAEMLMLRRTPPAREG